MSNIKLKAKVKHNGQYINKGDILKIGQDITEPDAERLIELGAAEPITKISSIIEKKTGFPRGQIANDEGNPKEDLNEKDLDHSSLGDISPEEMTREELESELTALGISFKSNHTNKTLVNLLNEARQQINE